MFQLPKVMTFQNFRVGLPPKETLHRSLNPHPRKTRKLNRNWQGWVKKISCYFKKFVVFVFQVMVQPCFLSPFPLIISVTSFSSMVLCSTFASSFFIRLPFPSTCHSSAPLQVLQTMSSYKHVTFEGFFMAPFILPSFSIILPDIPLPSLSLSSSFPPLTVIRGYFCSFSMLPPLIKHNMTHAKHDPCPSVEQLVI